MRALQISFAMLKIRDLDFSYPNGESGLAVPKWDLAEGESVALVGPSGAGKTTFLKLVCGIHTPKGGSIECAGIQVTALSELSRRVWRLEKVGVVFQDFALLDYLTVRENLLLPRRLGTGVQPGDEAKARELADHLEVGRYWNKLAGELSQGERQRVAIARALVHRPALVLADEPTASLDPSRRTQAVRLILEECRSRKAGLIMVTHDPDSLPFFDRVVSLEELRS